MKGHAHLSIFQNAENALDEDVHRFNMKFSYVLTQYNMEGIVGRRLKDV